MKGCFSSSRIRVTSFLGININIEWSLITYLFRKQWWYDSALLFLRNFINILFSSEFFRTLLLWFLHVYYWVIKILKIVWIFKTILLYHSLVNWFSISPHGQCFSRVLQSFLLMPCKCLWFLMSLLNTEFAYCKVHLNCNTNPVYNVNDWYSHCLSK